MSESSYIEVTVASFRLALPASCVVGMLTDVLVGDTTPFRGERLPLVDLAAVFAGTHRLVAPFALAVESRGARALVGVDAIAHERLFGNAQAVPKLGMLRPDLFEGALRVRGAVVLVLAPRSLVTL